MNTAINNQSPSFGTFVLKDNGARELANYFHSKPDPAAAEKHFIKEFAEPINGLQSTVTYDGNSVLLTDSENDSPISVIEPIGKFKPSKMTSTVVSVMTTIPNSGYNINYKEVSFENENKANSFMHTVNSIAPLEAQFLCAKELAREFDKRAMSSSKDSDIDATENRLKNLYG